jgi:hypothetical protein
MACEVERSSTLHRPILHSQLVLPKRKVVLSPLPENCESLWTRVNRICDQYMPELFDMRMGPKTWCAPGENAQR